MNLPNQLTVARFVMALGFVVLTSLSYVSCHIVAYLLFIVATITDYYDGKIARERNLVTNFGKLLDPVADKVLLLGAFVMLMRFPGLRIPAWAVVIILAREFLITGVRSLAATTGVVISANFWGKTKAVIQMVYVFAFMFFAIVGQLLQAYTHAPVWTATYTKWVETASLWAMVFVAVITIFSGLQFMRVNWRALNLGKEL